MIRVMAILIVLGAISTPAHAGDGDLQWRTIETRHFRINFPAGLERLGNRAAELCEEAHEVMGALMNYAPRERIEVSVTDFGDGANGSATALPYPRISLLAAPPKLDSNLNDYDDWFRLLVFHEYLHILQLDQLSGLPAFLSGLFGRTFAPNQNLPSFILEGGAVWAESLTSSRGRIHSARFRGLLRAQALSGRLFGLDAITHAPQDWPGASVWYLYGGHFLDWVFRTRGHSVLAAIHQAISDELVPYGINRAAREATGQTLTSLYRAWLADLTARSRAEAAVIERAGPTPYTRRTTTGRRHANLRFAPDGSLWSLEGGRKPAGIYARRPDTPMDEHHRLVMKGDSLGDYDLCARTGMVIYDRSELFSGAYQRHDLFMWDPRSERVSRLTHGARLREAVCLPDGRGAIAVQIVKGRTRLVRVDFADGRITPVYDPGGLDQVAFPTVSPDGGTVVFTRVVQPGARDLFALTLDSGDLRPLTADAALELHARFDDGGRWLLYASDRSGIFDIYAVEWATGVHRRVTRVVTGASGPTLSPDGRRLAFQILGPDGYDIAETDFDPRRFAPVPEPAYLPPILSRKSRSVSLPSTPYAPSTSLWPVGWTPAFAFSNATESASQLGIEFDTSDPVGLHAVTGNLKTTADEGGVSMGLNYAYRGWIPVLSVGLSHSTQTRDDAAFFGLERQPFQERVSSASVGVSLPFTQWGKNVGWSVRYYFATADPASNRDPVYHPLDPAPRFPQSRRSAVTSMSVSFQDRRTFAHGISTDEGRSASVSLRVRHPTLGGESDTAEVTAGYREYVPLWARHVLAFKMDAAFGRRATYRLGPPPERNVFLDAVDNLSFGSQYLRGYDAETVQGDRYVLATAAYRLPLLDIFGGLETVPLFLGRFKLALFTDWAQAAKEPLDWRPSKFYRAVGAELVTEATVGWRLPMRVRMGWAKGLDEEGTSQVYFYLGNWF